MTAPGVFDDLPPEVLEALAEKFAAAYEAGRTTGRDSMKKDITAAFDVGVTVGEKQAARVTDADFGWQRYWSGYADAVAMMTGVESDADGGEVDPEAVAAADRLIRRTRAGVAEPAGPAARPHRHTMRPALRTRRAGR